MPPSPEFDLSWLWDLLNSIAGTIQSWFETIWTTAQNITNTGQGIFSGLVAFGSQIWDAILKGIGAFGEWIYNTFKWIYDGIVYWANVFGEWISYAFQWVGSGLNWIAQQIFNFGNWLYNGLVYIWNLMANAITGLWNSIVSWFSGIATAISDWWQGVTASVNQWLTNILKTVRQKILQTIVADVSIYFGWKSVERLTQAKSLKDGALGLMGMLVSPFAGYLFGSIVNGILPEVSTEPYQLIPTVEAFTYTPTSLTVETPTEKPHPEIGTPPTAPPRVVERGLPIDLEATVTLSYDITTSSKDKTASITATFEYEVD